MLLFIRHLYLTLILAAGWFCSDLSWSMKDAVFPDDPIIFIGDNLTLSCELPGRELGTSKQLYFTSGSSREKRIEQQYVKVVSLTKIELNYPVTSTTDMANYLCWLDRSSQKPVFLGHSYVEVEYRPQAVKNVSCIVYNWENMTCSWSLDQQFVERKRFTTILIWRIGLHNNGTQFRCEDQTPTSCTWHRHSGSDNFVPGSVYKMQVITLYNRTTSFTSKTAETASEEFIINTQFCVKPAPPTMISVMSVTSTCVHLQWTDSTPHRRNKTFKVEFQSERDTAWKKCCDSAISSVSKCSVEVCDLVPATRYIFRVASKPKPRGFWSAWQTVETSTDVAVPARPPEIAKGGYMEDKCVGPTDCRNVTVFFKPLRDEHRHGKNVDYVLYVGGDDTSTSLVTRTTSVTVALSKKRDYSVRVHSRNEEGESKEFTEIFIPNEDKKPSFPKRFVVEAEQLEPNVTKYRLSWLLRKKSLDAGCTIYWCHQLVLGHGCKHHLNWRAVKGHQTTLHMILPDSIAGHTSTYKFGISREVEVDGNIISSGIQWSHCIYSFYKNSKLPYPPDNFKMMPIQEGGVLGIMWQKPACRRSQPYITHYVIRWCETGKDQGCTDSNVTNTATSYIMRGLKGDVTYSVNIRAASRAGLGPPSVSVEAKVKLSGLQPGAIAGIVIGVVVSVVLVAVFMIYRICSQTKGNYKLKMRFIYPLNNFRRHQHEDHTTSLMQTEATNGKSKECSKGETKRNSKISKDSGKGESSEMDEQTPCLKPDDEKQIENDDDQKDGYSDVTKTKIDIEKEIPDEEYRIFGSVDSYSKYGKSESLTGDMTVYDSSEQVNAPLCVVVQVALLPSGVGEENETGRDEIRDARVHDSAPKSVNEEYVLFP